MHLNIKNNEAHQLAFALSQLTGESLTLAVTEALRERLAREKRRLRSGDVTDRLMQIGRAYAALPDSGASADSIIGYDAFGLPS